ncbi:hypothetical protein OC25_14635 [Pedobacter kyungheensis]|uniref:Uncharacterized protein n=1 Tax=Pedobacter kyungheensis TaxID=1069985 RepID=A0A0C1DG83_9SPHI|nr:hypothetical protein [Pedobacter kyungheensis]KIA92940.1 hypothetical protein OC25_14635 [Pedobacter kyungheensis]
MKIKTIPTIATVLIYALFTLLTFENNATSDGFTKLGFPFSFYVYSEGKLTDPGLASSFGFSIKYFLIDVLILTIVIVLVNFITDKWKKEKKTSK